MAMDELKQKCKEWLSDKYYNEYPRYTAFFDPWQLGVENRLPRHIKVEVRDCLIRILPKHNIDWFQDIFMLEYTNGDSYDISSDVDAEFTPELVLDALQYIAKIGDFAGTKFNVRSVRDLNHLLFIFCCYYIYAETQEIFNYIMADY